MCGRMLVFTNDEVREILRSMRRVENPFPDWPARAPINAYPQSEVPVVASLDEAEDAAESPIRILRWGYPVGWSPSPVFNTRIESLLSGKGMWRESAENGRCLIPTRGFFERHATETVRSKKTGRPVKRQYEFKFVDEPVTWLAGISEGDHFSVVTTEPNRFVAPVHNRMPVVLRRDELEAWLSADWVELADRSGVVLDVLPEELPKDDAFGDQMSLF
ncbi:MAG: SOS response-associated peptidase family protein [Coriobacteriia bacterium]|nr:SOS response-associated peptidase family protein [Coriobacteriia bacterium]